VKELASTGLARALAESRAEAPELAAELGPYRFEERGHLIRTHRRFVSWGLCEWLCHESVRLTAIDAERAVESAELAVLISDLLKETEPARARRLYRLRGYTWAHDGNARRVLGDLRGADESFSISDAWWEAGTADATDSALPEYEPALLDLKVSLRIAQRRFPEALVLLDRLFALHTNGERPEHQDAHLAGRTLVKKALALAEMEEPDRAIGLLREAETLVDVKRDRRLLYCMRHNLLWNLTTLARFDEARALLPEVAGLRRELGNPLDLLRLRWTEARITAGLGRTAAAIRLFERLQRDFAERGIAYDTALVMLELTALHAQEGRTAEVKRLSADMARIFRAQDVPREALAALLFFEKAAERERATARLAREIAAFLGKLRSDPGLRFDLLR
jgi:tetratricopeptide (TPR) repeat protein